MYPSRECLEIIKKYEGLSLEPYVCPAGKWTIGYGHVIPNRFHYGRKITEQKANDILRSDVDKFASGVNRLGLKLTQSQFDALVSFSFNVGLYALKTSTLYKKLKKGDYNGAASEFGRWIYTGRRPLRGLIKRRADEAVLFTSKKGG